MSESTSQAVALEVTEEKNLRSEIDLPDPLSIQAGKEEDPKLVEQAVDVVARILSVDMNDSEAQNKTRASG